ncbi:MAG: response regulator [Acidobacteriota bacterium]|jgi:DNA-binding response OmpR family regulator
MSIRVLLVDDEVSFSQTLAKILSRRGFIVATAGSGEEALVALAREPWDVVLLDVKMPDRDGLSVLGDIRAMPDPPEVIMLTGHLSRSEEEAGLSGGAFAYLLKPHPIPDLESRIRDAAQSVRHRREKTENSLARKGGEL